MAIDQLSENMENLTLSDDSSRNAMEWLELISKSSSQTPSCLLSALVVRTAMRLKKPAWILRAIQFLPSGSQFLLNLILRISSPVLQAGSNELKSIVSEIVSDSSSQAELRLISLEMAVAIFFVIQLDSDRNLAMEVFHSISGKLSDRNLRFLENITTGLADAFEWKERLAKLRSQ